MKCLLVTAGLFKIPATTAKGRFTFLKARSAKQWSSFFQKPRAVEVYVKQTGCLDKDIKPKCLGWINKTA